jgi:hypothetical protein
MKRHPRGPRCPAWIGSARRDPPRITRKPHEDWDDGCHHERAAQPLTRTHSRGIGRVAEKLSPQTGVIRPTFRSAAGTQPVTHV